jgi:hypothetical protein
VSAIKPRPFTFDVMSLNGWNDAPITVLATGYQAAADLAVVLIESERGHEVLDVMDTTIVIADELPPDHPAED